MFKIIKKEIDFGCKKLSIETGKIARQANSVFVRYGDTSILCNLVSGIESEIVGFFPLVVNYIEKKSSVGKIPGGFLKREGKQSDKEILTSRVIDRSLRPLFPDGFYNEVQVTATLFSYDKQQETDVIALIGCSAALAISGLPINSIVAGIRVGLKDSRFIINPTFAEMKDSDLDLTFAGTRDAIFMVESEANELSEKIMLDALAFAKKEILPVIQMIEDFAKEANVIPTEFSQKDNTILYNKLVVEFEKKFRSAYDIKSKQNRYKALKEIRNEALLTNITTDFPSNVVEFEIERLESHIVRNMILDGQRIDGRDLKTVRPINIETGILPASCVHGSALFTRGETQALISVTLGSVSDEQFLDSIEDDAKKENFMLHYNFPSYSVGETGRVGAPGRREIGHGKLAHKAISPMLPKNSEFPYTLRVVSDITESNGSSSMATVCGTSLGLAHAGVPIKKHVAGIAMGLIKENDRHAVLTDIMGDEDHLGDMDFKVAGTRDGITALQMDIKIQGITENIMKQALEQAKEARYHILDFIESAAKIGHGLNESAPRIAEIKIKPEKIGDIIGKGGATIKSICETTGAKIDISDTGVIKIFTSSKEGLERAVKIIEDLTTEIVVGNVYIGIVSKIMQFGAFISLPGNQSGMVHISEISNERVANVSDYLHEGQKVKVIVLGFDEKRRLKLSIKKIEQSSMQGKKRDKKCECNSEKECGVVDFDAFNNCENCNCYPSLCGNNPESNEEDTISISSFCDFARKLDKKD